MTFIESLIVRSMKEGNFLLWIDNRCPMYGEYWEDIDMDRRKEIEDWCAHWSVDVEQMIETMRHQ